MLTTFSTTQTIPPRSPVWRQIFPFDTHNLMYYRAGRAIVCLEQYPVALHQGSRLMPLFAMRFLEALTPIKRVGINGRMLEPVPGELLTVTYAGTEYVPWIFLPQSPNKRQEVTEWIEQQASQTVATFKQ
jgi:hypothetical protein